ncbi:B-cell receptor CD22-like protein [Leptotrombidium deliense]|uniref:B-cell receptor CD22-like protein n=1 Tax=Leptotrombidium deliense TaxID=299467 RepID=A0A443SWD4_9ACAR|nr:B-cell receptor CD22-like protein [Leptotrombidium deliense]
MHSPDGNSTWSSFTLIATANDDQKWLVCRAENPKMKNVFLEDVYTLNIHCECVFIVERHKVSAIFDLLDKPKLSLALLDKHQFVVDGNLAVLQCNVASNPVSSAVTWTFNDKPLLENLEEGWT